MFHEAEMLTSRALFLMIQRSHKVNHFHINIRNVGHTTKRYDLIVSCIVRIPSESIVFIVVVRIKTLCILPQRSSCPCTTLKLDFRYALFPLYKYQQPLVRVSNIKPENIILICL